MRLLYQRDVMDLSASRLELVLDRLEEIRQHESDDQGLLRRVRYRLQFKHDLAIQEFHKVNGTRAVEHEALRAKRQPLKPRVD